MCGAVGPIMEVCDPVGIPVPRLDAAGQSVVLAALEGAVQLRRGRRHPLAAVTRFVFYRDAAFWLGCAAYTANRWAFKAHLPGAFLRSHFNDLWLVPCALPLVLWMHDRMGWRADGPPRGDEVLAHLAGWSVLFEWIGPWYVPWATADPWDVACYAVGAIGAWLWWRRRCAAAVET